MNQECKDLIIKNFVTLMKECNVESLKIPMLDKGIFTEREINEIFKSNDTRHNKRIFFFRLQKKDKSWFPLLESLRETNQSYIADIFLRRGATVFNPPTPDDPEESFLSDLDNLPVNPSTTPLDVHVTYSDRFYDTYEHNFDIDFYKSRSKKRGRALIINNYEFNHKDHPKRNGATVDNENLEKLFAQMGGWDLDHHNNKTALEMDMILKNFAHYKNNHLYDICFVIIMSHGAQRSNDTIIYGVDENVQDNYVSAAQIQKLFSNENCRSWSTKPKVMVFPVCRGQDLQYPIKHELRTETDSIFPKCQANQSTNTGSSITMRPEEDMLIGYSTLLGYKAHRDPNRGSWYIELLCKIFMNYAHNHSVDSLMMMIDQGLRRRMSENHSMQTAEYRNKGFKRLYLHPGLYSEDDVKKRY